MNLTAGTNKIKSFTEKHRIEQLLITAEEGTDLGQQSGFKDKGRSKSVSVWLYLNGRGTHNEVEQNVL